MLPNIDYFFNSLPYILFYSSVYYFAGGVISEDSSSELFHELSNEDINVVNMLLAEEVGTELWTNELFDKTS
jgi:hypothetical protein